MLEKDIEKHICDYAKTKGFLVYKFTSPGHKFVPDRMFINPQGGVFFIEFKREGGRPTEGQLREHARMRAQGVNVYVVDNLYYGKLVVDGTSG